MASVATDGRLRPIPLSIYTEMPRGRGEAGRSIHYGTCCSAARWLTATVASPTSPSRPSATSVRPRRSVRRTSRAPIESLSGVTCRSTPTSPCLRRYEARWRIAKACSAAPPRAHAGGRPQSKAPAGAGCVCRRRRGEGSFGVRRSSTSTMPSFCLSLPFISMSRHVARLPPSPAST